MPEGNLHGHMTGLGTLGGHLQGSGTTDYNELENRPKINNHTLEGNHSSDDLGLQSKINFPGDPTQYLNGNGTFSAPAGTGGSYSGLTDKPMINDVELEGNLSLSDLDIQEEINFPGNPAVFLNGEGNFAAAGSSDYNPLTNKPQINGHTLSGNQTSSDLGLQDEINFPGNTGQYLNGAGSFTAPTVSYNDVSDKPSINGHTLEDNQTSSGLGLQDAINFGGDSTKFLSDDGSFREPDYFSGDYDDLTDKPSINGNTLEGDKTGNQLELTSGPIFNGSGTSVDFETQGTYNLLKCIVNFESEQSGSGTPSPSNPRPISGYSYITINVSPTSNPAEGVDTTIQLGSTYYVGTLDATNGILTVTHAVTDINTAITSRTTSYVHPVFYGDIAGIKVGVQTIIAEAFNGIESKLSAQNFANNSDDGDCTNNSNNTQFFIRADAYTDVPSLKADLGTTKILYELATPLIVQLDPTVIEGLTGQNYITAGGHTVEVDAATAIFDPVLEYLVNHR